MNNTLFQIVIKICVLVGLLWYLAYNYGLLSVFSFSFPTFSIPSISLPLSEKEKNPIVEPQTNQVTNTADIIYSTPLPNAGPLFGFKGKHSLYAELGAYQTNEDEPYYLYYPFLNISGVNNDIKVHELSDQIILSTPLPINPDEYNFFSPMTKEEIKFSTGETLETEIRNTKTRIHGKTLFISFHKRKPKIAEDVPATNILQINNNTYVMPYEEISQIKYIRKDTQKIESKKVDCIDAHIQNKYVYSVTVSGCPDGALILNRPYQRGWKAYYITSTWNIEHIMYYLPFLFGKEIKDHMTVNSWANGWTLRSKQSPSFESQGSIILFVIYWPHYQNQLSLILVTGGFLTLTYLLWRFYKNTNL